MNHTADMKDSENFVTAERERDIDLILSNPYDFLLIVYNPKNAYSMLVCVLIIFYIEFFKNSKDGTATINCALVEKQLIKETNIDIASMRTCRIYLDVFPDEEELLLNEGKDDVFIFGTPNDPSYEGTVASLDFTVLYDTPIEEMQKYLVSEKYEEKVMDHAVKNDWTNITERCFLFNLAFGHNTTDEFASSAIKQMLVADGDVVREIQGIPVIPFGQLAYIPKEKNRRIEWLSYGLIRGSVVVRNAFKEICLSHYGAVRAAPGTTFH